MDKDAHNTKALPPPPAWVILVAMPILAVTLAILTASQFGKEKRFSAGYAQARTQVVDSMGSATRAEAARILFKRTDLCRSQAKRQLAKTGMDWVLTSRHDAETAGRQAAKECLQAQIDALEGTLNPEFVGRLRVAR